MRTTTGTRRALDRLALGGLAGTLAIGLAACGGGSGSSAAAGSATTAATSSSAAPSSAASPSSSSRAGTPSLAELAERVSAAQKAKGTARMVSTSGGAGGVTSTGVIRYRGSGVDFSVSTAAAGKTMKIVFVGGAMYMNVGEKYEGKSWLRIAPGGSDPLSQAFGPMLTQLSTSLDLRTQLTGSKDSKVTASARTELGGVPATRYTLVSTEKALLAQLETMATTPEMRTALREQFKGAHGESVLWIGDDSLPMRVDSRVVGPGVPAATTTVTYSDWGKPVTISAPPRSDVADLAP